MGVIIGRQFSDGYTPICEDCGIVLCFDISEEEYYELKEFWDKWRCEVCDPNAIGSRKRYIENESKNI